MLGRHTTPGREHRAARQGTRLSQWSRRRRGKATTRMVPGGEAFGAAGVDGAGEGARDGDKEGAVARGWEARVGRDAMTACSVPSQSNTCVPADVAQMQCQCLSQDWPVEGEPAEKCTMTVIRSSRDARTPIGRARCRCKPKAGFQQAALIHMPPICNRGKTTRWRG